MYYYYYYYCCTTYSTYFHMPSNDLHLDHDKDLAVKEWLKIFLKLQVLVKHTGKFILKIKSGLGVTNKR